MRLHKFLNEAVIKPNVKNIFSKVKNALPGLAGKDKRVVVIFLNKLLAEDNIKISITSNGTSDPKLSAAGISYAEIEKVFPFPITVFMDDFSVFEVLEDIEDYWLYTFFDVVSHELIHREQFARGAYKSAIKFTDFKSYLANKQEIMALAHDTYMYFLSKGMDASQIKKSLKSKIDPGDFVNLEEFLDTFDTKTPEYKLLLKYIYDYITQ